MEERLRQLEEKLDRILALLEDSESEGGKHVGGRPDDRG